MPLPSILTPRTSARLTDAILSLQPTAYWSLADGSGPLRDLTGRWPATVTGSPTFGVAAPSPIERGVTFSGTGQYALSSASITNVTTSVSLLAFIRTTNASAAVRYIMGRHVNYALYLNTGHTPTFAAIQNTTASHCAINAGATANNGQWHMVGGTFDGTTAWAYMQRVGLWSSGSNATLTGTWNKGANAHEIASIASGGLGALWTGDIAHGAFWADRVLTAADFRHIGTIAFGG